jgi:hypothetical protein
MEYDPKDLDVVNLLKNLKEAGGRYPQEMLALRRQSYLKQVAGVIGGGGLMLGARETLKSGKAGGSSSATVGKVVELVLVAAIVAEAGVVTYFYGDRILDFLRSFSNEPKVEEISTPPVLPSLIPATGLTPTLVDTPTFVITDTPLSTPSPELAAQPTEQNQQGQENSSAGNGSEATPAIVETDNEAGGGDGGGSQPASTPNPNGNNNNNGNNNGNNGNHYGQTPKPERTKEPGNDNSNNNHDDQDNIDRDNRGRDDD